MIFNIGTDIVNIQRIEKLLEKSGEKFTGKYFTSAEIKASKRYAADNKQSIAAHFAKRFAAKEAFAKSMGTGLGKELTFKDISVENEASGRPVLVLSRKAKSLLTKLAGKGASVHISLSDDYPYAVAMVVIEAD